MTYPPPPGPPPYGQQPYPPQPPKKSNSALWITLAILAGIFVLCGGCVAVFSSSTDDSAEATTTRRAPVSTTSPASVHFNPGTSASGTAVAPPPVTTPAPRTTAAASSRCKPAPDTIVALINASFKDSSYTLGNPQAIEGAKDMTWISGHIMQGDKRISSADVWISKGPLVYAISGDARRQTTLIDGRDLLNVSAGDDTGLLVQGCVPPR